MGPWHRWAPSVPGGQGGRGPDWALAKPTVKGFLLGELVAPCWSGYGCLWLHWPAAPLQSVLRGFCGVLEGAGEGVMVGHGLQVRGGAGDRALLASLVLVT